MGLLLSVVGMFSGSTQGCVAIRSTGGLCLMENSVHQKNSTWSLGINTRYFESYKHFVGKVEQTQREAAGTNVINHSYTADLALVFQLDERWSFLADIPIIYNTRSSLYEHANTGRYQTSSYGLGDIRFAAYKWLIRPNNTGNLQAGLGLKLPTGDYHVLDRFHTSTSTIVGPVDQSIQLGDGGLGLTLELNGYLKLNRYSSLYGNFYYLANPREMNGVSTARGGTASASSLANQSEIMSTPDQYMVRGGINVDIGKLRVTGGIRTECVTVRDLLGGSNGFRRPGIVTSVEPGLSYQLKSISIYASVPIAISRNRTQSVPDKITTANAGKYTQGDAAFADYSVNVGVNIRL